MARNEKTAFTNSGYFAGKFLYFGGIHFIGGKVCVEKVLNLIFGWEFFSFYMQICVWEILNIYFWEIFLFNQLILKNVLVELEFALRVIWVYMSV